MGENAILLFYGGVSSFVNWNSPIPLREVFVEFSCVLDQEELKQKQVILDAENHGHCEHLVETRTIKVSATETVASYSLNWLDASANGIYGFRILQTRHKTSDCRTRDFMYDFRILNPVDPLASASNLYLILLT